MLLGMLLPFHWRWSHPDWPISTFDPKISFFLIFLTMGKYRGIFNQSPAKRPQKSIFSKFLFRTFFYHPEIPSSLYGAPTTFGGFMVRVSFCMCRFGGWVGGWNYRFGDLPPTPPKVLRTLIEHLSGIYIYIYIYIYRSVDLPSTW